MRRILHGVALSLALPAMAGAAELLAGVLRIDAPAPAPISRLDLPPDDIGFAGARLATEDNATTGGFLGHRYDLIAEVAGPEGAVAALDRLLDEGARFVALIADADAQLALADHAAGRGGVILNVSAPDDRLRGADCRANLFNVTPSRRMMADGLAQYLLAKGWTDWVLIHGSHPADRARADAYRDAARRYGARIRAEKEYVDDGGARRSDSGHVLIQKQIPGFMQGLPEHDVVVAADETGVFATYLPYRTWTPRPVVGDAGLVARAWHPAHEAFGATQLQRRFEAQAGRRMTDIDYETWVALRALGEAVTRTGAADVDTVTGYLLSDGFALAAFKGLPLGFRPWSRQLRQAIVLADGRNMVSLSPQAEFLHQFNQLDTLGVDRAESACALQ